MWFPTFVFSVVRIFGGRGRRNRVVILTFFKGDFAERNFKRNSGDLLPFG